MGSLDASPATSITVCAPRTTVAPCSMRSRHPNDADAPSGPGSASTTPASAPARALADREGVEIRLVHAKEPGPRFREDFDKFPEFIESDSFERILCPRMHMKVVIADGRKAYVGSANLTGAGMGAKSDTRRNFEAGDHLRALMAFADQFFVGDFCEKCQRRDVCPEPVR